MPAFGSSRVLRHGSALCGVLIASALCLTPAACSARHAPDQLIVRFRAGRVAELSRLNAATGATTKRVIDKLRYVSLKLPKGADLEKTIARYRSHPAVEYVGPNHIFQIALMPDDPVFYSGDDFWGIPQWGLYNDIGQYRADIHAPEAWNVTTGSPSVVIASVDTGVDYTHPDLASKIWTNAGENPTNGTDDDGNGYIDDWHGWDFVNNDNDPDDDHEIYHGTFTSGVAAAAGNNGTGMAGVSWGSPVLITKVIRSDGYGLEDDAAAAIVYAVDLGAKVINLSLSGEDAPAMRAAVDYAWDNGVLCVAASGNENRSTPTYPASYEHALAVGATNENDQRATAADWGSGGSNYGSYLDVVAPGSWIVSSGSWLVDLGLAWEPYDTQSGTSAAAPFVSGVAALVWSVHPDWTNAEVFFHICHTADDIETSGWDIYTGWGRINAGRAVTEPIVESPGIAGLKYVSSNFEVRVRGKVLSTSSGDLPGRLYIQEEDRSSGILVSPSGAVPAGLLAGDRVDVLGVIGSVSGERAITSAVVSKTGSEAPPKPVGVSNRALGGGPFGLQGGVVDQYSLPRKMAVGLNNVGLLIRTYGKVTAVGYDWFYLDDGSSLDDGTGYTGVYVYCGSLVRPALNKYVLVTGISSCEIPTGSTVRRRILRPRVQDDIRVVK